MLTSLHVNNLALIDEEEINFTTGLNILSGETGAGKSIILGALHLCLGDKASKDMLRDNDREAFVEAVFTVDSPKIKSALMDLDIELFDDEVIMSRRLGQTRNICKINGEKVPAGKMKEVGELLIDIYGQKEHQSLLNKSKHMDFLDEFSKNDIGNLKSKIKEEYASYKKLAKEYEDAKASFNTKDREIVLLDYEINEIEEAKLTPGEDDDLEDEYRHLSNYSKTMEYYQKAHEEMNGNSGFSDALSRAISAVRSIEGIDSKASDFLSMLVDADNIISDFNRELSEYMSDSTFDEEAFRQVEQRINEINRLKDKYGNTIEKILAALEERVEKKSKLTSFDEYLDSLKKQLDESKNSLTALCQQLSDIRHKNAAILSEKMQLAMKDLNFMNTEFTMELTRLDNFTDKGFDDGQFMISTNPGEPLRPLKDIASGGEMSRIMLAIKTVLASNDDIETLIFDEIDAGISGRTAQAVSEKLALVADSHQVICITHLPQIASMADRHFLIEKNVSDGHTVSGITELGDEEIISELARMIGGSTITDTTLLSAKEIKEMADQFKKNKA